MGEAAEAEGALAPPYASSIDIIFTFLLLLVKYTPFCFPQSADGLPFVILGTILWGKNDCGKRKEYLWGMLLAHAVESTNNTNAKCTASRDVKNWSTITNWRVSGKSSVAV